MNLDFELILGSVIKLGKVTHVWSLDSKSPKSLKVLHQMLFFFNLINMLIIIILLSLIVHDAIAQNDYYMTIEGISHMATNFEVLCNWSICIYQRNKFQELLNASKKYAKNEGPQKKIFHKYLNNYLSIHLFEMLFYVSTVIGFMCTPFFSESKFPLPFYFSSHIEEYSIAYYMVFIWQTFSMYLCMVTIVLNLTTAILITVITTKLDMLALKIKAIENNNQLNVCIQKHQKYIRYAKTLNHTLRFLILKALITMLITIIFGALPILYYRNLNELLRALLYIGTCLIIAYILAWAADDMHQASLNVSLAIYKSDWTNMPTKMRKSMIIMMCRAQRPLNISVSGILPALTLKFYAQFLSFALSYIMTLRAILL